MTKRDGPSVIALVDKRLGIFRSAVAEEERRWYAERKRRLAELLGVAGGEDVREAGTGALDT